MFHLKLLLINIIFSIQCSVLSRSEQIFVKIQTDQFCLMFFVALPMKHSTYGAFCRRKAVYLAERHNTTVLLLNLHDKEAFCPFSLHTEYTSTVFFSFGHLPYLQEHPGSVFLSFQSSTNNTYSKVSQNTHTHTHTHTLSIYLSIYCLCEFIFNLKDFKQKKFCFLQFVHIFIK